MARSGGRPAATTRAWRCAALAATLGRVVGAGSASRAVLSPAATKARVESGDGVPFFQERFGCRDDGEAWTAYRELVQYSRLRIFERGEGPALARALAYSLAERTSNLTEVLQCNVGIIAGYHLLARRAIAEADDWRAYSLLQLALIWVFTLRNANKVPFEAAKEWFTRSDYLIHEIRTLRRRLTKERARWIAHVPSVAPSFRAPGLRIAIVSVCAYPPDHPLELKTLTPENRLLYARRHGYALHVHRTHPLPEQGVHIQHAKLALMAEYLKSGLYDWVAWFDCDSILMNMDKTLDSIIHRYARRRPRRSTAAAGSPPGRAAAGGEERAWRVVLSEDESAREPEPPEAIIVYVAHAGSCNSEVGCTAEARVHVRSGTRYAITVETALIDMEDDSERLASVEVGGRDLGPCNPRPASDYDCGFFQCFAGEPLPPEAEGGEVRLRVRAVKTNDDCACDASRGECYSAALGPALLEALGPNATLDTYGMFVRFTLTPVPEEAAVCSPPDPPPEPRAEDPAQADADYGAQKAGRASEPGRGDDIVAYLAHEGSCNTAEGCRLAARVRVDPRFTYVARVTTALIDMEDDAEKLASVVVGGRELGECNPSPESDYTCSYFDCFDGVAVPVEASSTGWLDVEVHSVRTHNDCHCSQELDACYNRAEAVLLEATGQGVVPPSHGAFVKITLTPSASPAAAPDQAQPSVTARPRDAKAGKQEVVAHVAHAGSCNTVSGCEGSASVRLDPAGRYAVTVETALIDMEDDSERIAALSVGGLDLGGCNPSPSSDFDCGWFECVRGRELPQEVTAAGEVVLRAHSVRTSNDCICDEGQDGCYAAALAEMYRAMGENVTGVSYGMFVRFTLTRLSEERPAPGEEAASASELPERSGREPLEDEVIEAFVGHIGSCNSDEGCRAETRVRVNPRARYEVDVRAAQIDMAEPSERLASVSVGGYELGECNPRPEDDSDCGYADCAVGRRLPAHVTQGGLVDLRVHAVRTSADCHCNRLLGSCYSAASAAMGEALGDEAVTDPRYGMFVRFVLTPIPWTDDSAGLPPWASVFSRGHECAGGDVLLGTDLDLEDCLAACGRIPDCRFVGAGTGRKAGRCFWQLGNCSELEEDYYDVYEVFVDDVPPDVADQATSGPKFDDEPEDGEEEIADLLITEEGWGLSSANWLIRRSDWSIAFLDRAFRLCHEEMPLFGDQDAMIHLLLNEQALRGRAGVAVDPHAVIIPQHEINAYDALNAHYMEADAYNEGDLLITFPGCKEAGACNPLFRLAAAHGRGDRRRPSQEQAWPHLRVFGPPESAAALFESARMH